MNTGSVSAVGYGSGRADQGPEILVARAVQKVHGISTSNFNIGAKPRLIRLARFTKDLADTMGVFFSRQFPETLRSRRRRPGGFDGGGTGRARRPFRRCL